MKIKYFSLIITFLITSLSNVFAQSQDHTYVKTTAYLEPVLISNDFTTSIGGWLPNGSVNYSLDNGRLKANVNSSWEGVKHYLDGFRTTAGRTLKVKITFDKGNTGSNIRLYLNELDPNGNLVSYNVKDNNLQTGTHQYSHTMANSGNSIIFRIDKDNTNTSTQTYFFIDAVSLKLDNDNLIKKLENVTYYDGFGKAKQVVSVKQSPNQKDIIQHIEYDEFGRASKQFSTLPTTQNNGHFLNNAQAQVSTYYQNNFADQHPFSEVRYDNSPLNRRLEVSAVGDTWQLLNNSDNDHTVKFDYELNGAEEVFRFEINENDINNPLTKSFYSSNQLLKNIVKNENWVPSDGLLNTKEVFSDKNGRRIAEFTYESDFSGIKKLSTYYVYDKAGNTRYILTPKMFPDSANVNYLDYVVNWPVDDFITPTGVTGAVIFRIFNNELTIKFLKKQTIISPIQHTLNALVIKPLSTFPTLPDMYLGKVMASGPLIGSLTFEVGEASIANGNLVITRTSTTQFSKLTGSITVSLNSNFNFSQTNLDDLAFQYHYDEFNRQIEQKVPGKQWEYLVYDQLDRPILTQDANLKAQNKWLFNKHDVFGRVVYSGKYTNGASRAALQAQVDNFINNSTNKSNVVSRTNATNNIGGVLINYSNDAFPNSSQETLSISYFDDYNFTDGGLPLIPSTILDQEVTNSTKGLLTSTWTKILGSNTWSKEYSFYDLKGRVIYVHDKNYLGGYTENRSKLDFRGKVEQSATVHKRLSSSPTLNIADTFEYDHAERPLKHFQKINGQPEEMITSNYHNELGQLVSKNIGGIESNSLQTINYAFNIRGWLSSINNVNSLGADVFAYDIKYDEATEGSASVNNIYNGNIKQVIWRSAQNNLKKSYAYEYDDLDRFTTSVYRENNSLTGGSGRFETYDLRYDTNGNINQLKRNSNTGVLMDRLGYTYDDGNKLLSIGDSGGTNDGFYDGSISGDDYYYDDNGNLIKDLNKGITNIEYNHLNLVERVTFSNGNIIEFDYDANGHKIKMKNILSSGSATSIDYLGGFQYTNSTLQFFPTPEGYVAKDGSLYKYVYIARDHLGNNRVSFSDTNNDYNINPSTEILSSTDHYVMGLTHQGEYISGIGSNYNYKYQGKEKLAFSDYKMYDFGSRMYDASVGRWFNADPQNQFASPYLAMNNNAVSNVDPNGEIVWAAVAVGAIIGAASSAAIYTMTALAQDNFSFEGLLGAALGGAIAGGIGGALAPKAILGGVLENGLGGTIANASLGGLAGSFLPSANIPLTDNASLSLSPALAFGNASGIGANASLNIRSGDFSASIGAGTSYLNKAAGTGNAGFETRLSASAAYGGKDFNVRTYSTLYHSGETSQVVGGIGLSSGDFSIRHENDFLGDQYDRYRTAALEASYRGFTVGFSLFTGDPSLDEGNHPDANFPGATVGAGLGPNGSYLGPNASKYRLGAAYVGYRGLRIGENSERVRDGIQNWLHDKIGSPRFPILSNSQNYYFQFQSNNPFSLW